MLPARAIILVFCTLYSAVDGIEYFKSASVITAKSYAYPPDKVRETVGKFKIKKVTKPFYTDESDNAQFGYAVALATLGSQNERQVMLISSPGNPSIANSDPGFVEIQEISGSDDSSWSADHIPTEQMTFFGIVTPKRYDAHTMFGSTIALSHSFNEAYGVDQYNFEHKIYAGAPNGARCDEIEPVGDDSISFDNFGSVYERQIKYRRIFEIKDGRKIEMDVCFKGEEFAGDNVQTGFAQTNRNLFGFSMHLSRNDEYLAVGAPLLKQQSGYVWVMRRDSNKDGFEIYNPATAIRLYYLCDNDKLKQYRRYKDDKGKKVSKKDFICDPDLTYGYSITSVAIHPTATEKKERVTYLATGGPRARGVKGEVKVFRVKAVTDYINTSVEHLCTISGQYFNSGFGTTLTGLDLNGDGNDELLVGEPYYTEPTSDTYNSGRVSVYEYDHSQKSYVLQHTIYSPQLTRNGMFGFKVVNIGDANDDGGEDFLVTALTLDSGKVIMYSGRDVYSAYQGAIRRDPEVLQIFTPKEGEKGHLFGFSIGEHLTDLDQNGYFDLIIGDPGENYQQAQMYWANTIIRILYPDQINTTIQMDKPKVHDSCPSELKEDQNNFCWPVQYKLENRGRRATVIKNEGKEVAQDRVPWEFEAPFTVSVKFSKIPDSSSIQVSGVPTSVEFGRKKSIEETFFIYGKVPEVTGATIEVKAETTEERVGSIVLVETTAFKPKGDTLLAPSTSQFIKIAISTMADVTMDVYDDIYKAGKKKSGKNGIILGTQSLTTLTSIINIKSKTGREEHFVNGELLLEIGNEYMSLTDKTYANNIVSCNQDASKKYVRCKFPDGKNFKTETITLVFDTSELAAGLLDKPNFKMTYKLTFNNKEERDSGVTNKTTTHHILYDSELKLTRENVLIDKDEEFPYSKRISTKLENKNGISKIGKTEVTVYAPQDNGIKSSIQKPQGYTCKFAKFIRFSVSSKGDRCSSNMCSVSDCVVEEIPSGGSIFFGVTVEFDNDEIGRVYWKQVASGQRKLFSTIEVKVKDDANYKTQVEGGNKPDPDHIKGTFGLTVRSTSAGDFPWWIVVVSLVVFVVIISLIIFLLHRRGFFTKRDSNDIYEDEIGEHEYADEDAELQIERTATRV